ncbi:MAG TPA: hypothetical protein VG755_15840 [Nannocystaceae bacterium]|nr:hypothetical protein [Nannocystaceae bacterium]
MTTKKYESARGREARGKAQRIKSQADEHQAELARLREAEAAAAKEAADAEKWESEVLTYANAQGLAPERAELDLARRVEAASAPPADAMDMSPAQYRRHRESLGIV